MAGNLTQLNKKRLQNAKLHKCEVTEEDYKRIAPKIELLERLAEVENSIYAVYDMNRGNYLLTSPEQKRLFGNTEQNKKGDYDADVLYQNIHPDDLPFVLETDNMIYQFFSELPPAEKKAYKLVYDFRVKNTEEIYKRYMHQVIILEQDKNGTSWLSLVITDLLSERAGNEKPQRRLLNIKTGKQQAFPKDKTPLKILLTKRETEVLSFIARGYDSKNIAERLIISVNTVNNHRQNILRKTRTDNTTQALLVAQRLGII